MTGNEYQYLAARTINLCLSDKMIEQHALFGMCSEVGELQGIYQKSYQGHGLDANHMKKEVGDLLWFIAEYCSAKHWKLEDIMELNINKLKARYPEKFTVEQSLNRAEGDI